MGKQRILFSLTPYGQQQVRDNIRLSFLMARKYLPPYGVGVDDWQAECHMVLCQAVAWHSPEKGALSTLFSGWCSCAAPTLTANGRRSAPVGICGRCPWTMSAARTVEA